MRKDELVSLKKRKESHYIESFAIRKKKKKKKKTILYYNERVIDVSLCKADSELAPYRSQEVHYDHRVIDDRRVTPPDTCDTEDEPNM
ncbi:hypothetical protein PUN28_020052 [Cardiocondyla obscurior]|uniref:Uncharacterized protein n=1 Tax=Cardiocondyla obscurior TaxID=286306 RepID=A0AAW2EAD6_9HYME